MSKLFILGNVKCTLFENIIAVFTFQSYNIITIILYSFRSDT